MTIRVHTAFIILATFFFNKSSPQAPLHVINCDTLLPETDVGYNFSFLKETLKDKNYVFLGEKEHGDGETLLAKVKLIKYLHDSLKFNVLLTEYEVYEAARAWNVIQSKRDSGTGVLSYLKYFSGDLIGLDDLYLGRYLNQELDKKTPLVLGGIDINQSSIFHNKYISELRNLLVKLKFNFNDPVNSQYWNNYYSIYNRNPKDVDALNLKDILHGLDITKIESGGNYLISFLIKNYTDSLAKCFIRYINSEIAFYKESFIRFSKGNYDKYYMYNFRDSMMGENLNFLLKFIFPDQKVIISTSTLHITKNMSQLWYEPIFNNYKPMIEYLDKEIISKSYVLPFLRYSGSTGKPGSYSFNFVKEITPAPPNSLEFLLSQNNNYCFVDFNTNKEQQQAIKNFTLLPITDTPLTAKWFSLYDGVFFIKEMKPAKISLMINRLSRNAYLSN